MDHFANEVAAAAAQKPRAARREARVFAPRVVARVPAVEPQRTPEAAHAVRFASVVEARFRDLVETRAREVHMRRPAEIKERLLSGREVPHVLSRGLHADHIVDHLHTRLVVIEIRVLRPAVLERVELGVRLHFELGALLVVALVVYFGNFRSDSCLT